MVAVSFPLALVFTNGAKIGRFLFGGIAALTLLGTLLTIGALFLPALSAIGEQLFIVGCGGCVLTTWIANFPQLRRPL